MAKSPYAFTPLIILLALSPASLWAYSVPIHDRLPDSLASDPTAQTVAALPDDAGLERFRARFYEAALKVTDTELRARFLTRYPKAASFDTVGFKEFFGMAATQPALGFDPYARVNATADDKDPRAPILPGVERPLLEWARVGSVYPDLDRRNQGRWLTDEHGFPRSPNGSRIPHDPVVLNMGRVEGLSGQAHAHYGLNRNPKSQEVEVLKTRPEDFAVPVGFPEAPVLTFAPERAQAYGDLALIAKHFDEPALAALYAGNAFHYLGDVGNQIHTIQVGLYDFFIDATLQAWKLKFITLGGLFGETMERNQIGIDIISNHHTWSEEMFRIVVERAATEAPLYPTLVTLEHLFAVDAGLTAQWSALSERPEFMSELAYRIIDAGNREGPEIYALAREITTSDLRKAGVKIEFDQVPDRVTLDHLKGGADPNQVGRFLTVAANGTRRAATAIHVWWKHAFGRERDSDIAPTMARLLKSRLDELDAADRRRAVWLRVYGN